MEMRIRLWKERKTRKRGTLTCTKCKTGGHFALYEGGLCKGCSKPEKVVFTPRTTTGGRVDFEQLPGTVVLQAKVEQLLMGDMTISRLAMIANTSPDTLARWLRNERGEVGQRRINAKISAAFLALEEKFQPSENVDATPPSRSQPLEENQPRGNYNYKAAMESNHRQLHGVTA